MSVQFTVGGTYDVEDPDSYLDVNHRNARDLLSFLGLTVELDGDMYGSIRSGELMKLIEAARTRPADRGRLGYIESSPDRATVIGGGRPPERMGQYLDKLETLCARAGELGVIRWY